MSTIRINEREIQVTKTYYDERTICDMCLKDYDHAERSSYERDTVTIEVDHGEHFPEGGHFEHDNGEYHLCGPCFRKHIKPLLKIPQSGERIYW